MKFCLILGLLLVDVTLVHCCGNGICRTPFGVEYTGGSCGDETCSNYGIDPRFDDSDRPPNAETLGRATWTVLHTTAAYLPDQITPIERQGFALLARSISELYPGDKKVFKEVFEDTDVQDDLSNLKTREDAQLWSWKVHNAVTSILFPLKKAFPLSAGIQTYLFDVRQAPGQLHMLVLSPALRAQILGMLNTRWRAPDDDKLAARDRDRLDLPPNRDTIGRAFWTFAHSMSVYIPRRPTADQLDAFRGMLASIHTVYPCSDCRDNFAPMFHDATIQKELFAVTTRHEAIMLVWKLHNMVTARGLISGDLPETRRIFPPSMTVKGLGKFNTSQFLPDGKQLELTGVSCDDASTPSCLDKDDRYEVLADVQSRWEIEGGIDLPLLDDSPPTCPPPTPGQRTFRLDMYLMGKCPWCANAIEAIADLIKCDFECEVEGKTVATRLDFQLHFVGLNNGTYHTPSLTAIHGPSELVAERLELCGRKHYPTDYQYLHFMKCMDANVTTIPTMAAECAREAGMDLRLLTACANRHGDRLVARSYGYASWMGIDTVPTFVLGREKQILGLPKNFTASVCEQIAADAAKPAARARSPTTLAEAGTRAGAAPAAEGAAWGVRQWAVVGLSGVLVVAGAAFFVLLARDRRGSSSKDGVEAEASSLLGRDAYRSL